MKSLGVTEKEATTIGLHTDQKHLSMELKQSNEQLEDQVCRQKNGKE